MTINAPFCLRKDVRDASKGGGFFFVNNGILVCRDDTMMIPIYDGETFRTNGGYNSVPASQINFWTVTSIEFTKIYSTGLNFEGGIVTVTGRFDREIEDIITIKMIRIDYKLLATLLKEIGLWSNNNNNRYCYITLQYNCTYFELNIIIKINNYRL